MSNKKDIPFMIHHINTFDMIDFSSVDKSNKIMWLDDPQK